MAAFVIPLVIAAAAAAAKTGSEMSKRTKVSKADEARLAELERRKASGDLGLSDEELAAAQGLRLDPIKAQARSADRLLAGRMALDDYSGGQDAKAAIAQQQALTDALQPGLRDIQAADVRVAQAEKADIEALKKGIETQKTERKQQTWAAIFDGLGYGLDKYSQATTGSAATRETDTAASEASKQAELDELSARLKNQMDDYQLYRSTMGNLEAVRE